MKTPKPPLQPQPKMRNRPLAQPKAANADRPLTAKLIAATNRLIKKSGGRLTRKMLEAAIGKGRVQTAEYIHEFRSSPNLETGLRFIIFGLRRDPNFMRFLNGK